jgi:Patatin-like phospholipase
MATTAEEKSEKSEQPGKTGSAGSGESAAAAIPRLEARQGRHNERAGGWGAPPDRRSRAPSGTDFEPTGIPAVYLIEREAIRLRRRRWEAHGGIAEAAAAGAADAGGRGDGDGQDDGADSLEMYSRPREAKARDASLRGRIVDGLKAFFGWRTSAAEATDRVAGEGSTASSVTLRDCPQIRSKVVPQVPKLVGLALSGGGIRSASFNLGFLQGLAEQKKLADIDYLSTVSGGGFIGAWWSAWLSRRGREMRDIFPLPEELEPQRRWATAVLIGGAVPTGTSSAGTGAAADGARAGFGSAQTPGQEGSASAAPTVSPDGSLSARREDPIHFVRLFSNYLTPKTGIMSPDTWRLVAFFVRSLLCTWLALVPLLFAAVMAVQSVFLFGADAACAFLYGGGSSGSELDGRLALLAIPALVLLVAYATLLIIWVIETAASKTMAAFAVAVLWVAGWLLQRSGGVSVASMSAASWAAVGSCVGTVLLFGVQSIVKGTSQPGGGAGLVYATAADRRTWLTQQQERLLKWSAFSGVLLLVAAFGHDIVIYVFKGVDSFVPAAVKKAGGWGALALTGVSGVYTLIKKAPSTTGQAPAKPNVVGRVLMLLAPPLVVGALLLGLAFLSHELLVSMMPATLETVGGLVKAAIALAVVEVFLAVYECYEDPDGVAPPDEFSWRRFVPDFVLKGLGQPQADETVRPWYHFFSPRGWARMAALSGILAVLGLRHDHSWAGFARAFERMSVNMVAAAILGAVAMVSFSRLSWRVSLRSARPVVLLAIASVTATLCLLANGELIDLRGCAALLWVCVLTGGVIAFGWLADPNLISLHGFYKARISRAYLGASNTGRDNQDITDAAPGDDVDLKDVWNHDVGGPYHIVNSALNLVGGSDLATSQRLAENFVMTRYHCGSARAGYRCTATYMSGELSLATAVAISGAAVSPTMGSKSPSAALTLLLSLFNVRLGFWAPTPSGKRWYEGHARLWPFYLLRETLANTGTLGTYCYLTDGGHFDNTGLYALIERGCRIIVVCDCGADPEPSFEDIGTAIRRCRIDFGAEISLKIDDFVTKADAQGVGSVQVGRGKIVYQAEHLRLLGLDEKTERVGDIVWVKPTVIAKSAADVRQYRRAHSDFPQQSTAEQWYDESQFESYRRLGYESGLQAFAEVKAAEAEAKTKTTTNEWPVGDDLPDEPK